MLKEKFLNYSGKKLLILGGTSEIGQKLAKVLADMSELEIFSTSFDLNQVETFAPLLEETYDYVVDLAHGHYESLFASASDEDIEKYFKANIINRAKLIKALSRKMLLKRFGRFVYISSAALNLPAEGQGFYVSSKLAIEGIYKQLGRELASKGLSSICLRYSYIDAGRGRKFLNKLSPETVVSQIAFFLSDEALTINGTTLTIDAGNPSYKYKDNK